MRIPITKRLTEEMILPCIAITAVVIFQLYTAGQKKIELNVILIILFGIPTILLSWFLLDKRFEFKEFAKSRKADRYFKLPFSLHSTFLAFIFFPILLFGGLLVIISDKNFAVGIPMFLFGLIPIILTAIAIEHPKIWFSDTINVIDLVKEIAETPKENFPAYQDGIFTYKDESFDVKIDGETKHVNWDEINSIIAYKVDLLTVDSIIIEIYADDFAIKIDDQMAGSMKFMETAADKLENFRKDWYMVVAFPAFETNLTIIYEKINED
ncbi:MAG: hypothetical protein ACR2J3_11860 [Aridibacter sp.]